MIAILRRRRKHRLDGQGASEVADMTMARSTPPMPPRHPHVALPDDIRTRVWQEARRARLEEVLRAVVIDALGPGAAVAMAREERVGVEDVIRSPVAAATSACLERLAADLETALPRSQPMLLGRLGDERLRAELGYD
jgi:hypothetical protein